MGKTIGIISIKGGVGKTTSVVALGAAIAGFGKKVLLVDANFSAPNLGIHLNILDPPVSLHDVMMRKANISDAIYSYGGVDIIPCSVFNNSRFSPLRLKEKLRFIKRKYDVVLIDSSPALNEETLAAMFASDELIVMTTPDYATLSMTLKAVKLARQRKTPITGIILNKVYNKSFEISLDEIERTAEVPVMAVIPHDLNILKSQREFTPFTAFRPNSRGSIEFQKLAAALAGKKFKPAGLRRYLRFTPKREAINREIYYSQLFN